METYFLGAYWFDRKESVEQCTERVIRCLAELGKCDAACSRWFRGGRSRKQALEREFNISDKAVKELLLHGQHRRDVGKEVIEDMGFSMSLWNGGEDCQSVGFRAHCGAYTGNLSLGNSCVVNLPSEGPPSERLLRVDTLLCLMRAVVESFDPDWATVMPDALLQTLKFGSKNPAVGWLFYGADRVLRLPRLPATTRVVSIPSRGNVVVTSEDRSARNGPNTCKPATLCGRQSPQPSGSRQRFTE